MQRLCLRVFRSLAGTAAVAGLVSLFPVPLKASVVFYGARTSFDAAEPGLPVEGFNNASIANQGLAVQASPLSSATNNNVFATGSILPGVTVSNLDPLLTPGLVVYGNNAITGGTTSVGTNYFGDSLVLTFATGVSAVGADVFAATSPGSTLAGMFTEQVFNGSTLLGSTNFTEAGGAFGFEGVSSTVLITKVQFLYTTEDATTFVDNIEFGAPGGSPAPPPPPGPPSPSHPTAVPEPSTFAFLTITAAIFASRLGRSRRGVLEFATRRVFSRRGTTRR